MPANLEIPLSLRRLTIIIMIVSLTACSSTSHLADEVRDSEVTQVFTVSEPTVQKTKEILGTPNMARTQTQTKAIESITQQQRNSHDSTKTSRVDGVVMRFVPAGKFYMGSSEEEINYAIEHCIPEEHPDAECPRSWFEDEQPQHTVDLDAFWIDQTEVTNEMFLQFLRNTGADSEVIKDKFVDREYILDTNFSAIQFENGDWNIIGSYSNHPVTGVTWYGADAYCSWAGRRLPTEAEWEKAARGTEAWVFPWGFEDIDCGKANYGGCVGDTTPVGRFPDGASPYGALDMVGNVWEWVQDWYKKEYYSYSPTINPRGPQIKEEDVNHWPRVLRGGWYFGPPGDVYTHRAASRWFNGPNMGSEAMGFRSAKTP